MRMPTYSSGQQIQAGDWVRVYSSQFGVWHHGIVRRLVLVPGGIAVEIIHNTKGGGVSLADFYEFADQNVVILHRRASTAQHAAQVVTRAEVNIGKPYFLFAQNCGHFTSFAFTGQAESESVKALAWMGLGVLAVALISSRA